MAAFVTCVKSCWSDIRTAFACNVDGGGSIWRLLRQWSRHLVSGGLNAADYQLHFTVIAQHTRARVTRTAAVSPGDLPSTQCGKVGCSALTFAWSWFSHFRGKKVGFAVKTQGWADRAVRGLLQFHAKAVPPYYLIHFTTLVLKIDCTEGQRYCKPQWLNKQPCFWI